MLKVKFIYRVFRVISGDPFHRSLTEASKVYIQWYTFLVFKVQRRLKRSFAPASVLYITVGLQKDVIEVCIFNTAGDQKKDNFTAI